jgi:hypothetical protein
MDFEFETTDAAQAFRTALRLRWASPSQHQRFGLAAMTNLRSSTATSL